MRSERSLAPRSEKQREIGCGRGSVDVAVDVTVDVSVDVAVDVGDATRCNLAVAQAPQVANEWPL